MTSLHQSREGAQDIAEKLRLLAQPQRLMILSCLAEGERMVGDIEAATGVGQPALSQQLGELRRSGLVATRRASKQIYYRLANDNVRQHICGIEAMFLREGGVEAAPAQAPGRAQPKPAAQSQDLGAASFARVL